MTIQTIKFYLGASLLAISSLLSKAYGADNSATSASASWEKPAWLTELSVGTKESYDDNVLLVSGLGMEPETSWITTVSPKIGINFVPLLGKQTAWQILSLGYAPDFAIYHDASEESYSAHKIAGAIKGKTGAFAFSLDNAFLFVDGDSKTPLYALDQGAAATGQYDKNRSAYATATARERRKQIQDRSTITLLYSRDKIFVRAIGSLLYYDFMTDLHLPSVAPYKGYQNYADRSDKNGGVDFGYKLHKDMTVTAGYRYGHQYQQAYAPSIDASAVNGQQTHSSADYQRFLLGLEARPAKWLTLKLTGGPEFRDYNSAAPVDDYTPVNYYGEASVSATLTSSQTLSLLYKHWQWLSSTGKIPYADTSYAVAYRYNASKQLGFDLSAKYTESDYTCGSPVKTLGSSLRVDSMASLSAGVSYAYTSHLGVSVSYACDFGRNRQENVPSPGPDYREFDRQLVSLSAQYKF